MVFFTALVFGVSELFIRQGRLEEVSVVIVLACLAVLWVSFLAVSLAVVGHPGSALGLAVAPAVLLVIFSLSIPALGAAILLLLLITAARRSLQREINDRIHYRARTIFSGGIRLLLVGLLVAAIGLAWPKLNTEIAAARVNISPQYIEPFARSLTAAVPGPAASLVNPIEVSVLAAQTINQYIQNLISSHTTLFIVVVVLAAFLTLRALVPVAAWFVLLVVALLVRLARAAGLLYISRSQATIESLHL